MQGMLDLVQLQPFVHTLITLRVRGMDHVVSPSQPFSKLRYKCILPEQLHLMILNTLVGAISIPLGSIFGFNTLCRDLRPTHPKEKNGNIYMRGGIITYATCTDCKLSSIVFYSKKNNIPLIHLPLLGQFVEDVPVHNGSIISLDDGHELC